MTQVLDKMSKTDARSVARDLANGEFDNAVSKMSRYDANSSEYMKTARKTLEDIKLIWHEVYPSYQFQ